MTPRTSPMWETARRSRSPTSGGSESRRTHGTRRRCWRRYPTWRHRPPKIATGPGNQPMSQQGGQAVPASLGDEEAPTDVWGDLEEGTQAVRSPRALTSSSSSRCWPWSAGLTHSRASRTTSTQSSTRGLGDQSAGEPGRAPGAGAGGGDLLGER